MYTVSSSASTENGPHMPVLPEYDQESFSQLSLPNSPGCGMVWKIHNRFPVFTSKPRIYPFAFVRLRGAPPPRWAAPTITTSLATMGPVFKPISPVIGSST